MTDIHTVAAAIRARHFDFANEEELQEGLALALADAGYPVRREVVLDGTSRIDLMVVQDAESEEWVPPGIGIEVKVAGRSASVLKQLERYARFDQVTGLILVTSRRRTHGQMRSLSEIDGKPFLVVDLLAL